MNSSRLMRAAVAATLVASLAIPASAMAVGPLGQGKGMGGGNQGKGAGQSGQGQQMQAQKQTEREARLGKVLSNRIARTLSQRVAKFDRAEARLTKRIARLTEIADKATANKVDVTVAREALVTATDQLAVATAAELEAQNLFKAVPGAPDRRAAFAAARAQAKVAQKALQLARLDVVKALQALHTAIDAAKTTTP